MKNLMGKKFGKLKVIKDTKASINQWGGKSRGWECVCDCGEKLIISSNDLLKSRKKSCGCLRKKNGRSYKRRGYVFIKDPTHLNSDSWGYVAEHVKITAGVLGRKLNRGEFIHHKNGIKTDNNPMNLELWTKNHPSGVRVSDLTNFCIKHLETYKPEILKK